jgi:hypothetical protein
MRRCVVGVVIVVAGVGLCGCSSDTGTEPTAAASSSKALCADAEALRGSLAALGDVQVAKEGTDALQAAWTTVRDDWAQLADDARTRYADEVDHVQASADVVKPAVDTVMKNPSAQALGNVTSAVGVFVQDAGTLVDEVGSTC